MKKFYDTFLESRGGSLNNNQTNNKLSPVTVYVPVIQVQKTLAYIHPEVIAHLDATANIDFSGEKKTYTPSAIIEKSGSNCAIAGSLTREERYIFTKEELCKFISDTLRDFDDKYNYTPGMKLLAERKEYIQSLF